MRLCVVMRTGEVAVGPRFLISETYRLTRVRLVYRCGWPTIPNQLNSDIEQPFDNKGVVPCGG
jgi:hypothetical protein